MRAIIIIILLGVVGLLLISRGSAGGAPSGSTNAFTRMVTEGKQIVVTNVNDIVHLVKGLVSDVSGSK